jgi:hypothetical protein
MITEAIRNLKPGANFCVNGDTYDGIVWQEKPVWEGGQKKPTKEEVEAEVARLQAEYDAKEYQRQRVPEYGNWKDQLNLLYDDIKSGNLENGKWVQMIEEVKARHPKPE